MKICKIFKFILPLVVLVLLLFFWETILNLVVSANLVVSQRNLFGLTFIFFLEILFLLVIYDIIINKLYIEISYKLSELGKLAVRKKKVRFALYTIRLNYYFSRLSHLLRLGWVSYGSSENSSVWTGLSKQNLTQMAINIFRFLFSVSVPLILAVLSACFSLKVFVGDIFDYLFKIQELLKEILKLKINISDIFSRLPAFVALTTVVPVIFFFYFYSQKRDVRKIIDKENIQYFEEVVLLFEQLLIWIDCHIYEISENFDYVINCQDSIVEEFLKKKVKNYGELVNKQYYIPRDIEKFKFVEIADLTELREIITKLSSDRLMKFTRIFSVKRFDIWYLYYRNFHSLNEEEIIEKSFYSKKWIASELGKHNTYPYDFTQEEIEERRKQELYLLSFSIYNSLDLLYRLKRASDSLRKYLYSSRTERLILKVLKKDK